MNAAYAAKIAQELGITAVQAEVTGDLLAGGATVPFLARYRKEVTGGLDEVQIAAVRDRMEALAALDQRRAAILKSLEERSLLTDALQTALAAASTMTALEDIFAPYRPKRRTRASMAKERGLEPLADVLFAQAPDLCPRDAAAAFISEEKDVDSVEAALAGARDIIAERVSDDAEARASVRALFSGHALVSSKVHTKKEEEGAKFRDYFAWSEPLKSAPSHRLLAMRRGEAEGILGLRIEVPEAEAVASLESQFVTGSGEASAQVRDAVADGYKRLLSLSIEVETRLASKERADQEAIAVFASNLQELLLAPALGQKNVLGIDPGFRSGCKVVCLDRQGKLLHDEVIQPHGSAGAAAKASERVNALCAEHHIDAVAIGNGTASRETESFVRGLGLDPKITVVSVSESGASIYSASEVAREEFPDHDLTVRGAVSIGRRLMDPLAELVKLDAKSIGVGQYQHDVDQRALKRSLDDVVSSCVNAVGVQVNTASRQLLAYVSGLGPQLAGNIVAYRDANGAFTSRDQLKKVPRLGPKAFEQAAGFLRIREGAHPLDDSAVHPERYGIVNAMAKDLGGTVDALLRDADTRKRIDLTRYVTGDVGLPTLGDIVQELAKPGRDPRAEFTAFAFAEGVDKMEHLEPGMKLPGIVTNVTAFGAFVDVGVHQDGLVHVSQIADKFVKNPADVVKVQQQVQVTVMEVDLARKRLSLSMRAQPAPGEARAPRPEGRERSESPRPPRNRPAPRGRPQRQRPASAFADALGKALQAQKQR